MAYQAHKTEQNSNFIVNKVDDEMKKDEATIPNEPQGRLHSPAATIPQVDSNPHTSVADSEPAKIEDDSAFEDDPELEDARLAVITAAPCPDGNKRKVKEMVMVADVVVIDDVIVSIPIICGKTKTTKDNDPISFLVRSRKRKGDEQVGPKRKIVVRGYA
jgi:hypothetical protein